MAELRVAFIGAGQVNFGGGEGPWNHAKRVEAIKTVSQNGTQVPVNISVVGIADPFEGFAQRALDNQRTISAYPEVWKNTQVFTSYLTMIETIPIDAVIIGVPPIAHGSTKPGTSIEIDCAAKGIHMLVDKPISCHPMDEVQKVADAVENAEKRDGLVVSVAYMFRYNKALAKMKEIIAENGPIRAFNARYMCAYSTLNKEMWWDVDRCGGPIIEQATHFCDLARHLGGEINLETLQALSIKQSDPLGELSRIPPNIKNMEGTSLKHAEFRV
jgi:predicted dehydrogenase